MRQVRIAIITALVATGVFAGAGAALSTATTNALAPICGAWEPRGGAGDGYRRLCIDGSLYWYEYR